MLLLRLARWYVNRQVQRHAEGINMKPDLKNAKIKTIVGGDIVIVSFNMEGVAIITQELYEFWKATGAENFSGILMATPEGVIELILQKVDGKTPSQVAGELRNYSTSLETHIKELEGTIKHSEEVLKEFGGNTLDELENFLQSGL